MRSSLTSHRQEAVRAEVEAQGFDEAAARWLTLLLGNDPTLPAPTAGAMVARVRQLPLGCDLSSLDDILQRVRARDPDELTTSERRVIAVLLRELISQADALLGIMTQQEVLL